MVSKRIASVKVFDRDRGWKRLRRQILRSPKYVSVGVHGEESLRPGEMIDNVELMTVHEFGSYSQGIPERSVIRLTIDTHLNSYRRLTSRLGRQVYHLAMSLHSALDVLGAKVAADMKRTISRTPGEWPPLKPATLAARENGGTRPLLDRGELRGSIKHKVQA